MDERLKNLIKRCFGEYRELLENKITSRFILKNVVPILYFGNLEKYKKSEIKIITAAINPSDIEFKKEKTDNTASDYRFNGLGYLFKKLSVDNKDDIEAYVNGLNRYFSCCPYEKWFNNSPRERLLSALNSSYYDNKNADYRVLHTDVVSPFATCPTWSKKIPDEAKRIIMNKGNSLWKALLEYLEPDIIFMSLKREYFEDLDFVKTFEIYKEYSTTVNGKKRKHKLIVEKYSYRIPSGKIIKIFNESITNCVPFNSIGSKRASELGESIFSKYRKGTL